MHARACGRSLSEYLLDKLRRRRKNMVKICKRWNRRYPGLFNRMRIFMLAVYLLLKGLHHARMFDMGHPHRGRLRMRRASAAIAASNSLASAPGNAPSGAAIDDVARLEAVNAQLRELLDEQERLAKRLRANSGVTGASQRGTQKLAPVAPRTVP